MYQQIKSGQLVDAHMFVSQMLLAIIKSSTMKVSWRSKSYKRLPSKPPPAFVGTLHMMPANAKLTEILADGPNECAFYRSMSVNVAKMR